MKYLLITTVCLLLSISVAFATEVAETTELVVPPIPQIKPETPPMKQADKAKSAIGEMTGYVAVYEDTLLDIARRFNLGFVELQAANPDVDPWTPGKGTKIVLPTQHLFPEAPHDGVVVNLGDMRIYLFDEVGNPVKSFPIGIGREGMHTPLGRTTVVKKKEGPWWFPTERMRQEDPSLPQVVKLGPSNPLGTHALYLGWPTFAIHGTAEPWGIGRRVSSGCVRMYPEQIPVLYEDVPTGTPVMFVDQEYKVGWIDDVLYLEAHPNKEQATAFEYEEAQPLDFPNGFIQWLEEKAGDKKELIDWTQVRQVMFERRGYPIPVLQSVNNQQASKTVSAKQTKSRTRTRHRLND